jgi:DNA modification methylase
MDSVPGACVIGDARQVLKNVDAGFFDACITSPPYFRLRDYGVEGQIGIEATPEEYTRNLVAVFRGVRRTLRDNGTLWLVIGDSYAGSHCGQSGPIKPKDLIGIPWRVAFALQADGWILRQDIIWHKPNAMPESVKDRCTRAHEYIFMFSKSPHYYYDHEAIKEKAVDGDPRPPRGSKGGGKENSGRRKQDGHGRRYEGFNKRYHSAEHPPVTKRNRRSVWSVTTKPCKEAHFAVFPPDLIKPCILAASRPGGVVLDPFCGSGTTGVVALENNRNFMGIEINPEYCRLANERINGAAKGGAAIGGA